jgi:hypothetical protein
VVGGDSLDLGGLTLSFQRTLRIPDDGKNYPLPPSLGRFPIRNIDDYAARVPQAWRAKGGVMIPMYQREAMWIQIGDVPRALKIGVGKICAVTGERWAPGLRSKGYVVSGSQPWLDGIATGSGTIRQFVAMPLGMGYTVEGQLTGEERNGGVQLEVFGPKPGRLPPQDMRMCMPMPCKSGGFGGPPPVCSSPMAAPMAGPMASMGAAAPRARAMGLAAGGRMTQKVLADPHGLDVWDTTESARVFVHIVSSEQWREITGEEAPPTPVTAKTYAQHGYPWFQVYDEHVLGLPGSEVLASVKSVAEKDVAHFGAPLNDEDSVPAWPVRLMKKLGMIRDGDW